MNLQKMCVVGKGAGYAIQKIKTDMVGCYATGWGGMQLLGGVLYGSEKIYGAIPKRDGVCHSDFFPRVCSKPKKKRGL